MRAYVLGVERVHSGGGEFGLGVRCQQFPRICPAGGAHWPTLEPSAQKGPGSRDDGTSSQPICHVQHDTSIFFLQFKHRRRGSESLRPRSSPGSKLWSKWPNFQAPKWILCWPTGKLWLSGNFHAS